MGTAVVYLKWKSCRQLHRNRKIVSTISQENQNLSQFAGKVFGGDWTIAAHLDEQRQPVVYVLTGTNTETPDMISHATIGLSDFKLGQDKGGVPLGAELVGGCNKACDYFDKALAACADMILHNNVLCKPGTIFANVLDGYDDTSQMKHFLFAVPSFWQDGLYPLSFKSKTVLWLQALPVSETEMQFARQHGAGELGEKLLENKADLADLQRAPVI